MDNLNISLQKMSQAGIQVSRLSPVYKSKAWGFTEQEDFLNAVAEVSFSGSAHHLLAVLNGVEGDMGRVRTLKWGPRTIDLDIIEFNGQVLESETLVLPHPLYTQRGFVLLPFKDLEPNWIPSGDSKSIGEYIDQIRGELPERISEPLAL
ncbi:MAG: 2-amino-4-hydroxy-6-hydroxymethyldihydropteridine diphosphokinase [Bacteroidia bacterium]|nr:2-amino-4-hydroxy-6-hydroxymethyldihydropteridine diphosphokinase [Bacteroidia bacterium]